jgi:hypothetical protein
MLSLEPDDKISIIQEIRAVEYELKTLNDKAYEINMQRKMLHHRLADLEYNLAHLSNGHNHGV